MLYKVWDNAAAWTMRLYIKRHDNELRSQRTTYKVVCGVTITSATENPGTPSAYVRSRLFSLASAT